MAGLIIDSSTDTIILALGSPIPAFKTCEGAARHGSALFSLIEAFLKEQGVATQDLTYIAAGRGPGSYTGTRAAVAAATGLSLGAHIPLVLFPSLLAFLPPLLSGKLGAVLEIKGTKDLSTLFYENGPPVTIQEKRLLLEDTIQELTTCSAVASAEPLLHFSHHPLAFAPEVAIHRIASWIERQHFFTEKDAHLVYLQPHV